MSKNVGGKCKNGDPDGRMDIRTDITIPSYVPSEDGRIKSTHGTHVNILVVELFLYMYIFCFTTDDMKRKEKCVILQNTYLCTCISHCKSYSKQLVIYCPFSYLTKTRWYTY